MHGWQHPHLELHAALSNIHADLKMQVLDNGFVDFEPVFLERRVAVRRHRNGAELCIGTLDEMEKRDKGLKSSITKDGIGFEL